MRRRAKSKSNEIESKVNVKESTVKVRSSAKSMSKEIKSKVKVKESTVNVR